MGNRSRGWTGGGSDLWKPQSQPFQNDLNAIKAFNYSRIRV